MAKVASAQVRGVVLPRHTPQEKALLSLSEQMGCDEDKRHGPDPVRAAVPTCFSSESGQVGLLRSASRLAFCRRPAEESNPQACLWSNK